MAGSTAPPAYAVTCSTVAWCYYYAPGPRVQYAPMVLTTDVTAWGLGTSGLSAHLNFRMNANAGGDEPFAASEPAFQFWEGYLSYQHDWFTIIGGRQTFTSRLGFAGFDGGRATLRYRKIGLEATGYLGLGLARASSVGVNDPVTAPLGDFIPGERSLIGGVLVGLASGPVEARVQWQRQVDRSTDYLMSDFLSGSAVIRPFPRFAVAGGLDYDLAQGWVGSADAEVRYHRAPRVGHRRLQALRAAIRPLVHLAGVLAGPMERPAGFGDCLAAALAQAPGTYRVVRVREHGRRNGAG